MQRVFVEEEDDIRSHQISEEQKTFKKEKQIAININQQIPNEKFYKQMKYIQGITQNFFYDLCEEIVKLSIWSYKMREVQKKRVLQQQNETKSKLVTSFFNNWKQKPTLKKKQFYVIDKRNDVYQQNMYSNYIPISQNVLPDDFLLQIFPIIERIDLYTIINELKMKENLSEQKRLKRWFKIIKKMNLLVDIEQKIWIWYIYKVFKKSLECTSWMQMFFQQPHVKQQNFSLKYMDIKRIITNKEYKYGITIEKKVGETIDPIVDLTALQKHYFCNICCIYDCRIHLYEAKKGQDYYHPRTFIQNSKQYSQRMLQYLISNYKQMVLNSKYEFNTSGKDIECGQCCYKLLTKEKIKEIKESINYPCRFTELEQLFLQLGEKRFYYNICRMALMFLNFKCNELFIFIIEQSMQKSDPGALEVLNGQLNKKPNLLFDQNICLLDSSQTTIQETKLSQQPEFKPFYVKQNYDDMQEKQQLSLQSNCEDDPWCIDDSDDEAKESTIQTDHMEAINTSGNLTNLAQKLSEQIGGQKEQKNVMNFLKEFVVNSYTQQEMHIKQEQKQQDTLDDMVQQSSVFLRKPDPEESDEDEGQLEENNVQNKDNSSHEKEVDDDECYGFTNQENDQNQPDMSYQHCIHYRHNKSPIDKECKFCGCRVRGFCDKYCMCDPKKCKIYRVGCNCQDSCYKNTCICFKKNIECDPDLCKSCYSCKSSKCKNNKITLNKCSRVVIANSQICGGMGLFNVFPLKKDDLIAIYYGELLGDLDIVIRDSWKPSDLFYIFSLMEEQTVDSKYMGNKSRFMNHSKNKDNSYARMVYAKGGYTIGLFSKMNILPGNELLFDYDGQGTLKHKYEWIKKKADSKAKQIIAEENVIVFEANNSPTKKLYQKVKKRK